jgi:hypothetical protein
MTDNIIPFDPERLERMEESERLVFLNQYNALPLDRRNARAVWKRNRARQGHRGRDRFTDYRAGANRRSVKEAASGP